MTSDAENGLSWEGDEERPESAPSLPRGWNAVGRGSEKVGRSDDPSTEAAAEGAADAAPAAPGGTAAPAQQAPMSTFMLLLVGIFGGVYLLYTVGWIIGGINIRPLASLIVVDAMYLPWFVLAIAAPALWMLVTWLLTRGKAAWVRVLLLLAGAVLLVPWPFVMMGVIGS